jgi:hypothetical protein
MQNTEMRPSPPDPQMPSEQSNSPSDTKEEAPPKQPSVDQTPPSMESMEDSYSLSLPKYPYYHYSEGNPLHYNSQDYEYGDYYPNSQEQKPYSHDHLHYYNSFYNMSAPSSTQQPMETTPRPEEKSNTRRYTFYYIGRKLWYLPMYFSAYFATYLTLILVKAVARHKIMFPLQYWADTSTSKSLGNGFNKRELELFTEVIMKALKATEHSYT